MQKRVITISREYGSGGRYIGRLTAEKLGIAFYDRDLIRIAAQESGLAADYLTEADESFTSGSPLHFSMGDVFSQASYPPEILPLPDQIHVLLSNIIQEIAEKEPCVIVGRSADHVLRRREDCLNVFIHAEKEPKLHRVIHDFGIPEKQAEKEIEKVDKARANYYRHYSGLPWGMARNYHVSLDSGLFGTETCADIIAKLARCAG
ncbi:MAG: cytidylate kinase-like family protein [Clostridiales Family XIII bacterium]|jgi:cytidylate kinase|nr:cytidylate kinase-like family protein [Clostridiales Family XIII bacterium]